MRTETINIYKFAELTESAKQSAIENYRNKGWVSTDFIYDEAYKTVKAFHRLFGTSECGRGWLDFKTGFEDDVLALKGMRLRTYIINNFGAGLFTPKYIGGLGKNEIVKHKRIKSQPLDNGNVFNPYYSGVQVDNSCTLTGVCYDHSILQPVYDFLEWNKPDYDNYQDIENLINDCFQNLEKDIESEVEHQNSDEAIKEAIEANDYEFTEEGELH